MLFAAASMRASSLPLTTSTRSTGKRSACV
jgi:hypothetical protein